MDFFFEPFLPRFVDFLPPLEADFLEGGGEFFPPFF